MDFGSGFLDDEEVEMLRRYAEAIGVDPMEATPEPMKCKYGAPHMINTVVWGALPAGTVCMRCRKHVRTNEKT
jgi:hypothetical protein